MKTTVTMAEAERRGTKWWVVQAVIDNLILNPVICEDEETAREHYDRMCLIASFPQMG